MIRGTNNIIAMATVAIAILAGVIGMVGYYVDSADAKFATKEVVKSLELSLRQNREDIIEIRKDTKDILRILIENK